MEDGEKFGIPEYLQPPERTDSFESTLAEKICRMLEGELSSKEALAHKTLHILNQKDVEISTLCERMQLLEALSTKQLIAEDLPPVRISFPEIGCLNNHPINNHTNNSPFDEPCSTEAESDEGEEMAKDRKVGVNSLTDPTNTRQMLNEIKINARNLNPDFLSAIYRNIINKEEEQNKFTKNATQLNTIGQSLKEQKQAEKQPYFANAFSEKNSLKKFECTFENADKMQQKHEMQTHPVLEPPQVSDWEQSFGNSISCDSELENLESCQTLNNESENKKISRAFINKNYINHNKMVKNKFKKLCSKIYKHEKFMSKTRLIYKELQKQGCHLMKIVGELKSDQQQEKDLTENLLLRIDKIADSENWMQHQAAALSQLEKQLTHVEHCLQENQSTFAKHEEGIRILKEELSRISYIKEDLIKKNSELKEEFRDLAAMVAEERTKVISLTEAVKKEKALNETMKQSYEQQLASAFSTGIAEQKLLFSENKKMIDTQINKLLQENNELNIKIKQVEDERKKITTEFKTKSSRDKKFLLTQVSIASQKLLFADLKIKELFLVVEKLLLSLYRLLFESEFEHIKRKYQEDGVQAATSILGVSPSEMTTVLAAGSLPNLSEWLDTCQKLAYKDKFSDDLVAFIMSIIFSAVQRKLKRGGAGDSF